MQIDLPVKLAPTLALLLSACAPSCATADEPPPSIHLDLSGVHEEDRPNVMAGAREWEACGVAFVGPEDADIVATVRSATVEDEIGYGWADPNTNTIILWSGWDEYTHTTAAHEVGHVMLHNVDHLPEGAGVMGTPIVPSTLTQADMDFACEIDGVCCHGAVSSASN